MNAETRFVGLLTRTSIHVVIEGYGLTSELALSRSKNVYNYLLTRGVPQARISYQMGIGFGSEVKFVVVPE